MDRTRGRSRALLIIVALVAIAVASPATAFADMERASEGVDPADIGRASTNVAPTTVDAAGIRHVGAFASKGSACRNGSRVKGLVDVLGPKNGSKVGEMPLVVRLELSKDADPTSLKVTLNKTRSIQHLFADCGAEWHVRLRASDLKAGRNEIKIAVRGKKGKKNRSEVVHVRFRNVDALVDDVPPPCLQPEGTSPAYLCPIRTQVPIPGGGGVGISVGWDEQAIVYDSQDVFDDPNTLQRGYQVLLLNRATLGLVRNELLCMAADNLGCGDHDSILTRLTNPGYYPTGTQGCDPAGCIIVIQSLNGAIANDSMSKLFAKLGGTTTIPGNPDSNILAASQYSLIAGVGTTGTSPDPAKRTLVFWGKGTAEERVACLAPCANTGVAPDAYDHNTLGGISGYLGLDATGNYAYHRRGEEIPFATGDGTTSNIITIGVDPAGKPLLSFPLQDADEYDGSNDGFQVVVVSSVDPIGNSYPATNVAFGSAGAAAEFLADVDESQVVLFRTFGNVPFHSGDSGDENLAVQLDRLGGSGVVFRALQAGDDYAFIGVAPPATGTGAPPSRSIDVSSMDARAALSSGTIPASNLRGWLTRNNRGFYEPTQASTNSGTLTHGLEAIAWSDLKAWPHPNTPAEQLAYVALSNVALNTHSPDADLRANYTLDVAHSAYIGELGDATYGQTLAGACNDQPPIEVPTIQGLGYSWDDFCAVWHQLNEELPYVANIWLLLKGNLQNMLVGFTQSSQADLSAVYNDVNTNFGSPPGLSPFESFLSEMIEGILYTVSYFPEVPEVGQAVGLLAETMDTANDLQGLTDGGDPQVDLSTTWTDVQEDLADRFTRITDTLTAEVGMTLTDWGRLSYLGPKLAAVKNGGDPAWQWKIGSFDPMPTWAWSMRQSVRASFYPPLLGAMFGMDELTGVSTGSTAPKPGDFTYRALDSQQFCSSFYPFLHLPLAADSWVALPLGAPTSWDIRIVANTDDNGHVHTFPTEPLMGPIFTTLGAVDDTKAQKNLGKYKPRFFAETMEVTQTIPQDKDWCK